MFEEFGVEKQYIIDMLRIFWLLFGFKGNGSKPDNSDIMFSCSMDVLSRLFGIVHSHTALSDCCSQHHVTSALLRAMYNYYVVDMGVDFDNL